MTPFDALAYFVLVMLAVTLFCAAYDRWLARYDNRVSQARSALDEPREPLDLTFEPWPWEREDAS